MKAGNERNGRSLLGITKIRQCQIDCPEIKWAKEVHMRAGETLIVGENVAADPQTTYVLDESDQRYELFVGFAPSEVLAMEKETAEVDGGNGKRKGR